jgi:hypothetical protein
MKFEPSIYVNFAAESWLILGRTSEARDEVCEDADVVCSVRIVVLCAIQALEP